MSEVPLYGHVGFDPKATHLIFLIRSRPSPHHKGSSLIRKHAPLGPYVRPMPRGLWWC